MVSTWRTNQSDRDLSGTVLLSSLLWHSRIMQAQPHLKIKKAKVLDISIDPVSSAFYFDDRL